MVHNFSLACWLTEDKLNFDKGWLPNSVIQHTDAYFKSIVYAFPGNQLLYTKASILTGRPATKSASKCSPEAVVGTGQAAPNILVKDVIVEGKYGLFPGVASLCCCLLSRPWLQTMIR